MINTSMIFLFQLLPARTLVATTSKLFGFLMYNDAFEVSIRTHMNKNRQ